MQKIFNPKTLVVLAALTLGVGCASAKDSHLSFEDGLKGHLPMLENDLGAAFGSAKEWRFIELVQRLQANRDNRFEHDFGKFLASDDGEYHHHHRDIDVSPVPEPTTGAMLLSGLAMVLLVLRRKSRTGLGKPLLAA